MSLVMLCGILSPAKTTRKLAMPTRVETLWRCYAQAITRPTGRCLHPRCGERLCRRGQTIVLFDPTVPEMPESIQVDRHGNIYVSLSRTGEIRKIAPDGTQSTLAFLPLHPEVQPCQNSAGSAGSAGIALDHQGNVYVGVNSCSAADLGIWKVTPDGEQSLLANLPVNAGPNGIAYHRGWLYVADSRLARVWRVHSDGQNPSGDLDCRPAVAAPTLAPAGIPGPNGLQVFHNEVYVSVSSRGHVVAFPSSADGSAGPGRVHVELGVDDFAFDEKGNLYAMTNFSNTVVRVTPDGMSEILLTLPTGWTDRHREPSAWGTTKRTCTSRMRRSRASQARIPAGRASCGYMSGSLASRGRKDPPRC